YTYSPYAGVSGVSVCHARDPRAAFIATIGPWEGVDIFTPPTVQVHHKISSPPMASRDGGGGYFSTTTLTQQGPQGHVVGMSFDFPFFFYSLFSFLFSSYSPFSFLNSHFILILSCLSSLFSFLFSSFSPFSFLLSRFFLF